MNIDPLIFIDTNIYLDFYEIRKSNISLSYLDLIEKYKDKIINSNQVEMEFKKNRQKVILSSLSNFKNPEWQNLNVPALLSEFGATKQIEKKRKEISTQQKKINEKIEKIFKNPSRNDPVYTTLQKIFNHKSDYNLDRGKKIRHKIRHLARKRFTLGYPPRKSDDITIGDAVNWEWIIHCAQISGKDIVIVTRDSDFGVLHKKESYLNDWLSLEFKNRVSQRRKIILTERLSYAFKLLDQDVSKEMEDAETKLIEKKEHDLNKILYDQSAIEKYIEEAKRRTDEEWSKFVKDINFDDLL